MHTLSALAALTGALLRRLLREGVVLRSLGFPLVLTVGTLLATLTVVAAIRPPTVVAVAPGTEAPVLEALLARGMKPLEQADPRAALASGGAVAALEDGVLYTSGADRAALLAEAAVRQGSGASWRLEPPPLPGAERVGGSGATMATLLCAIYALYGVVFGAGMIARDRDDGTFEVELSLPVPRWVHGAARLLAGSLVLVVFTLLSVLLVHALTRVDGVDDAVRSGIAACVATTALGLGSVGRASIKTGFAASLAAGLTAATGLLGIGWMVPWLGQHLPVASLVAGGAGWWPLLGALLLALPTLALFTLRTARP